MKKILFILVPLLMVWAVNVYATPFTVNLATEISGATAASAPIAVTFDDTVIANTVRITMDASALTADEAITGMYFNYTQDYSVITWSKVSSDATTSIAMSSDNYKADGDGFFDILFNWGMPGFDAGDIFIFDASATGISADYFNDMSVPGGGSGTWTVAAHVQSIGSGEDSGWMAGNPASVPEPATMLLPFYSFTSTTRASAMSHRVQLHTMG